MRHETPRQAQKRLVRWVRWSSKELWERWRAQFESDDEAIITAIWSGNRLVKDADGVSQRMFYSIKEACIEKYGNEGWHERDDKFRCRDCRGGMRYGALCAVCGGEGLFVRSLYLHEFVVAGRLYRMHSYVVPKVIIDRSDASTFRFSEVALTDFDLPLEGLLRVLYFVAAYFWKMYIVDGRYVKREVQHDQ